jgi:hypothetical protein
MIGEYKPEVILRRGYRRGQLDSPTAQGFSSDLGPSQRSATILKRSDGKQKYDICLNQRNLATSTAVIQRWVIALDAVDELVDGMSTVAPHSGRT